MDRRHGDGHVFGSPILHLAFLGTRHTALVSADDGGMAFSHLASRGLGPVARTIKTTRILGRYPPGPQPENKPRRPSSVLAFSALPLGNVERPTDSMGLTALLTPYLLVIVSTTPVAQTQYKAPRPKEIAPHSALSGCLAWFPAVKLKGQDTKATLAYSLTKLAYCWSNILTILDVEDTEKRDDSEKDKPPNLRFHPRSRWKSEEAVVAIQWLSRSVLGILTISQRLLILEDGSLRVTDSFDLLYKHIYHNDLFSPQLQPVVDNLDEDDVSLHGVIADAFYMSFRAYKGRLFLLGFDDISIGTLSNWADRLMALMEEGDFIGAISLATSYYVGDTDRLTVGLPEEDEARHSMVQEKLLDMIAASTKYQLTRLGTSEVDESLRRQLQQLTVESLHACISMDQLEFLLIDIYEQYEEASWEPILLEALEPAILGGQIIALPPTLFKDLITHYSSISQDTRLEEMICRLDARTMDIDSAATLFREHNLYDALIHVWNQAIGDYVTPFVELLSLIKFVHNNSSESSTDVRFLYQESAMKVFSYLAFALTGRIYPKGEYLSDADATKAQTDLYNFLFSSKPSNWPKTSEKVFRTTNETEQEPSFPYLQILLRFDTGSFMSMLNEAFEDSFLNGGQDQLTNGRADGQANDHEDPTGPAVTRQYIVSVLLGLINPQDYSVHHTIFLHMFIARSIAKFPQFILLSGSQLQSILVSLCQYPSPGLAADCQLSVEYLLSVYHPSDLRSLIPLFQNAGFYRILKSIYRSEREFASLLCTYFEDGKDQDDVFGCIEDCLRPTVVITKKQRQEVETVIIDHAQDLVKIDTAKLARVVGSCAPNMLHAVLNALDDSRDQYHFLETLLEPGINSLDEVVGNSSLLSSELVERYVQLMCKYSPAHVADFVEQLKSGDLHLDNVLPDMERNGVIDAAVVLMARNGLVRDAMDRLVKHLDTLDVALTGLVEAASESPDTGNTEETATDLLEAIEKYAKVGIWLCQGQTKISNRSADGNRLNVSLCEENLNSDELLWLDLLEAVFKITQHVSASALRAGSKISSESTHGFDTHKVISNLRNTTQKAFTALLATFATPSSSSRSQLSSTGRGPSPHPTRSRSRSASRRPQTSTSFLPILTAFLSRASATSPTLSDVRLILADIFSAYAFESTLLELTNQLLDTDVFGGVARLQEERERGWRPRGGVAGGRCEGCGQRAWGAGVDAGGGGVFAAWEVQRENEDGRRRVRWGGANVMQSGGQTRGNGKKRELGSEGSATVGSDGAQGGMQGSGVGALVVFACRHLFHKRCLEPLHQQPVGQEEEAGSGGKVSAQSAAAEPRRHWQCPLCK